MKIFKEVKIVKEVKRSEEKCREVMTCDVSPVAMFDNQRNQNDIESHIFVFGKDCLSVKVHKQVLTVHKQPNI